MNIHIKPDRQEPYDRALFQKILDLIDRYDCRKYVYFMAANDYVLALAQEMAPDIARCVGHDGHPENMIDRALKYDCKKIQWYMDQFDQTLVDRAHELGIINNVFYADTPEKCEKYLKMGMDTILTNDYNRISQIVERFRK
jgi:glycerophosphoryl diester phosphodiesterase